MSLPDTTPVSRLSGTSAVVTGASRGFGRATAAALVQAGATVAGIARSGSQLAELREQLGPRFVPVVADAADPVSAAQLLDQFRPAILVLNAGASPLTRPLHRHTWESFSRNWAVDVQQVFHWTREAVLAPLDPGSVVVAFSSGAARHGSPLSGGYPGAKATIRFIAPHAAGRAAAGRPRHPVPRGAAGPDPGHRPGRRRRGRLRRPPGRRHRHVPRRPRGGPAG